MQTEIQKRFDIFLNLKKWIHAATKTTIFELNIDEYCLV